MTRQRLISKFIADLEAYVIDRINTRLSDLMSIGTIKRPKARK